MGIVVTPVSSGPSAALARCVLLRLKTRMTRRRLLLRSAGDRAAPTCALNLLAAGISVVAAYGRGDRALTTDCGRWERSGRRCEHDVALRVCDRRSVRDVAQRAVGSGAADREGEGAGLADCAQVAGADVNGGRIGTGEPQQGVDTWVGIT